MSLTLRYAARSDRGLIREGNEDSVYAGPRLLAVADGMGGMAAGEVASNIVVGALAPLDEDVSSDDLVDALRRAINDANEQLRHAVEANPALEGMGTTLTALLFSGNRLALAHVGDSRAYVLRADELFQITKDDTYVQMLVDEGRITADEANTHPQRSLLTRALDGRDVDPDFSVREARPGDRYLLCSDGLSGVVSTDTIAEALRILDAAEAADRLIQLALRGGGPDNITCIVADIVDDGPGDSAPVVGGAAARDRTTIAGSDTAAGRAALASPRPEPEAGSDTDEDEEAAPRSRHRTRTLVLSLASVAALVALGGVGWAYTQDQYYVGADDGGQVVIYRGVSGSLAGVKFSSVADETDLRMRDLQQVARRDVRQTIPAKDQTDARAIVSRLRSQQLPSCPTASPEPSATGTPSPTVTTPRPTGTPGPSATGVTTGPSGAPSAPGTGRPTATPGSPSASPSPTPDDAVASPQAGVTCKEPR